MKCLLYCVVLIITSKQSLGASVKTDVNDGLENHSTKFHTKDKLISLDGGNTDSSESDQIHVPQSEAQSAEKRGWHTSAWGKRRWAGLSSWGKRRWMNSWGKRRWMSSWGKRSSPAESLFGTQIQDGLKTRHKRDTEHSFPQKRQWNHFVTWGKRSIPVERKWAMSAWGKRNYDTNNEADKRKWSAFSSWGKRDSSEDIDKEEDKRWAMSAWGKRIPDDFHKKWAFASWGKRDNVNESDDEQLNSIDKRRWSSFAAWGKRGRWNYKAWRNRPWLWAKRRRGWNPMSSWGKRSSEQTAI